jgi:hypothetical protein
MNENKMAYRFVCGISNASSIAELWDIVELELKNWRKVPALPLYGEAWRLELWHKTRVVEWSGAFRG